MESENILLGYQSLANEWQDGVLTAMLRKANRVSWELGLEISIDPMDVGRIVTPVGSASMAKSVEPGPISYLRSSKENRHYRFATATNCFSLIK